MSHATNHIESRPFDPVTVNDNSFADAYIAMRKSEQRIYTEAEIKILPDISTNHPHYREWQMRKQSLRRLMNYLQAKSTTLNILEIGCGNGWLASKLANITLGKVVGIDINHFELQQAEKLFKDRENLQFMDGDLRYGLPLNLKFDIIVFAASIQYFPSVSEIIKAAFQYIAPGGEVHILDTPFYAQTELLSARQRSIEYYRKLGFEQMSSWYFHHSLDDLSPFNYRILYNPTSWINKLTSPRNPFCWVCVNQSGETERRADGRLTVDGEQFTDKGQPSTASRNPLYHTFKRYRTLQTHRISALPIVILMPHSACNCRCIMCDIWKDNKNLKQLSENDIFSLLRTFKKFGTKRVVMSGGEAILNQNFFRFCDILHSHGIKITLLSTGLTIEKNAAGIVEKVDDIIISLDGPPRLHDEIRNIPGGFEKMQRGIEALRKIDKSYPVSGRSVIHRLNFREWPALIETAAKMGLHQISFLPADVSSHAFNREVLWSEPRQNEILVQENELDELEGILEMIIVEFRKKFDEGFIAESPQKLRKIFQYYSAFYGRNLFPFKKCNAPWVSTVIEADGTVRPCFFHEAIGNIRNESLDEILNSESSIAFRKQLDTDSNSTCVKCVCYLNLSPKARI